MFFFTNIQKLITKPLSCVETIYPRKMPPNLCYPEEQKKILHICYISLYIHSAHTWYGLHGFSKTGSIYILHLYSIYMLNSNLCNLFVRPIITHEQLWVKFWLGNSVVPEKCSWIGSEGLIWEFILKKNLTCQAKLSSQALI